MRFGKIIIIILLVMGAIPTFSQQFFPIKINKKWGLIDSEGRVVLKPDYDAIGDFQANGFAVMQRDGGVGLLSEFGREVIPPQYEDIKVLNASLISVRDNGEWKVINLQGQTILPSGYDRLKVINNAYLAFESAGKWGLVNDKGKVITEPRFSWIGASKKEGFLQIRSSEGIGLLEMNGNVLLEPKFEEIRLLEIGIIAYKNSSGWGLMNDCEEGKTPAIYDGYELISEHFVRLYRGKESFLYNMVSGQLISQQKYDNFYTFSPEYLIVKKERLLGLVDMTGREILSPIYSEIQTFGKNKFRVNRGGLWGLVGQGNQPILPFEYEYIAPLKGPVCLVKKQGKAGVANFTGRVIVEPIYDRIEFLPQQLKAYSSQQLTLLYVNHEGQLQEEQKFDRHFTIAIGKKNKQDQNIPQYESDYVLKDFEWFYSPSTDQWGLRKLEDGTIQIEPQFNRISVFKDLGFTLVGLERSVHYDFEKTTYRFNMIYGLVNNEAGLLVTEIDFLDLRLSDFRQGLPTARFVSTNGKHGLINRIGKVISKDFAFIGDFQSGRARASKRGRLSGTLQAGPYGIEPLSSYLNRLLSISYRIDYTEYDQSFEKEANLYCETCEWGYIDTMGLMVIPPAYSFAQEFINEVGIVEQDGKWGMVNMLGDELIPCRYDRVAFLENTDNQIVRVYKQDEKYGLIDTSGQLRVNLVYDEIGTFKDGRLSVKRNGLWGFVDRNGLEVIPCRFSTVNNFSEGYAAVKVGSKWGFIDKLGNVEIDFQFSRVGNFKAGLAWFVDGGKFGYMYPSGIIAIPPQFEKAFDFEGTVARVQEDLKFGLINQQGNYILRPKFSILYPFDENGLAKACYGNDKVRYGIINNQGDLITSQAFREIRDFQEGKAAVKTRTGYGFIDLSGRVIIEPVFSKVSDFSEGKAAVQRDGQCGYIDEKGKELVEFEFSKCLDFEDGKAVVYKGNRKAGLIDSIGRVLIEPSINKLYDFSEGRGLVRDDNYRFYYITEQANLYDGYYQKASSFQHGVAVVQVNDRWGIINQKGMEIIPPKYDKIDQFENGYAKVRIKGFNGLSNLKGELIIQPDYEYISYAGEGLFRVEQGDKIGYFDMEGHWVWGLSE